jgi:hypothetical protein
LKATVPPSFEPWRRCAALLAAVACLAAGPGPSVARGAEDDAVAKLTAEYTGLLKYSDFTSFSKRMQTIRDLGHIHVPAASAALLDLIAKSKIVDDKVVGVRAIGPQLTLETAKRVGEIVARRPADVLTEALGECYAQVADEAALTWLAGDALSSKHESVVLAALNAQYVHGDPRCFRRAHELFVEYSPKREGMAIAHAAVRALGKLGVMEARRFIIRAVGHEDPRVRLAAADVMADQEPWDINVRGALKQLLLDPNPIVVRAAIHGTGQAKRDEMLPEVAYHLKSGQTRTRAVAHETLVALTGKELGWDPDDWIAWWKFRSGAPANPPKKSTSVATYHGLNVFSDRLLFIIDLSGSMAFPWKSTETRIKVARNELEKVLLSLKPRKGGSAPETEPPLFNLIVFSDDVKAWRKGEATASEDSVNSALAWVRKTFEQPAGGTFMHSALETAFRENPQVDTIFLLTDGLATDGEPIVPEAILASINVWNRYRRVVIHTIALTLEELDPKGVPRRNLDAIKSFMRQVATLTGGESKIVTRPPGSDGKTRNLVPDPIKALKDPPEDKPKDKPK